jgi:hypothetical protein
MATRTGPPEFRPKAENLNEPAGMDGWIDPLAVEIDPENLRR